MKPRYIYLLTPPADSGGGVQPYSSLEALVADPLNALQATTAAIRAARAKSGYPVTVKGFQIDKLQVRGMAEIEA